MRRLDQSSRRLIIAHALSAIGMSLPWPVLLVLIWHDTQSEIWLGIAGAGRMAPYVLFSWFAGRIGDFARRDRVIRVTLWLRLALLASMSISVAAGSPLLAVICASLAVATATPAFPATAAALPTMARVHSMRATELLVTVEVGSFVVGPALGGLMVSAPMRPIAFLIPVLATAAALWVMKPVSCEVDENSSATPAPPLTRALKSPGVRTALVVVSAINFVLAFMGVALVRVAAQWWSQGDWAFGLATTALGFGAFAAPLFDLLGHGPSSRIRAGMAGFALCIALVAATPSVWFALGLLLLAGAVSTHVESAATVVLQESVPDRARASVLGLADTAMVGAAMIGALVAPTLIKATPVPVVLLGLGGVALACLLAVKTTDAPVSELRIPHQPAPKQIRGANESEAACAAASASAGPTPVASRA